MLHNRSIPRSGVMPVLLVTDVRAAAAWLCSAFGFVERLRIGNHRIQIETADGSGAFVVAEGTPASAGFSLLVRVDDADRHHAQAVAHGAQAGSAPVTQVYGERQYSAADPWGHVWTFSQSVADVDPADWGGELLRR
jgi:uncharacterized glyoxalase superfamily protein PhnB